MNKKHALILHATDQNREINKIIQKLIPEMKGTAERKVDLMRPKMLFEFRRSVVVTGLEFGARIN